MTGLNAWELSKENIQPLKSGRKIDTLMSSLSLSNASKLRSEKHDFELSLRSNMDDINIWFDYVVWTEQNYPSSFIRTHQLLERCVQHFRDKDSLKNDAKYLKLWLKLVDMLNDPGEVFNYLFSQDVGVASGLFYRAWADYCETINAWCKADEIYQLGINRNVDCVKELQLAYECFRKRFVKALAEDASQTESTEDEGNERVVLGTINAKKSGKTGSKRAYKFPDTKQLKGNRSRLGSQTNVAGSKFVIYGDENSPESSIPQSKNAFKELPLDKVIKKENQKKTERIANTKLKVCASSANSCAFQIFADEVQSDEENCKPVVVGERKALTAKKVANKPCKLSFFSEDALQINGNVVYKYCKSLTDAGQYEISFEELKAQLEQYCVGEQASINNPQQRVCVGLFDSDVKCTVDDTEDAVPLMWD